MLKLVLNFQNTLQSIDQVAFNQGCHVFNEVTLFTIAFVKIQEDRNQLSLLPSLFIEMVDYQTLYPLIDSLEYHEITQICFIHFQKSLTSNHLISSNIHEQHLRELFSVQSFLSSYFQIHQEHSLLEYLYNNHSLSFLNFIKIKTNEPNEFNFSEST